MFVRRSALFVAAILLALSGATFVVSCSPKSTPTAPVSITAEPETSIENELKPKSSAIKKKSDDDLHCKNADDCVLLATECGFTQVVHNNSEAHQMFGFENRGECDPERAPPLAVRCINDRCVPKDVGLGELREPCSVKDDCEVVDSTCGSWAVVSSAKADAASKHFRGAAALIKCKMPVTRPPEPDYQCLNQYCVPKF